LIALDIDRDLREVEPRAHLGNEVSLAWFRHSGMERTTVEGPGVPGLLNCCLVLEEVVLSVRRSRDQGMNRQQETRMGGEVYPATSDKKSN